MLNRKFYLPLLILLSQSFGFCFAASNTNTSTNANSSVPIVNSAPEPILVSQSASLATPTKTNTPPPTSVVIGSANPQQAKTFLQYSLTMPCEGWRTTAITFTGQSEVETNPSASFSLLIDPVLLREYGCQLKAKHVLQRGQRNIIIEAYQFATADGAFGTYLAAHRGSSSYQTQGDKSSEDQDSISFCKNQYFVYIYTTASDDEEAKETINKLAKQLIDFIKPSKESLLATNPGIRPEIFNSMPNLERLSGSEKLVMGPISLRKFFIAPYSTMLAPLVEGAVADFKLEYPDRDRVKLLIARYPSADQAKLIYLKYTDTLRCTNKEKTTEGYSYPTALFKVSDNFLLCQLQNKQIIVINGARHKDSPADLVHKIYSYY